MFLCAYTLQTGEKISVPPAGDSSDSLTSRIEGWLLTGWKFKKKQNQNQADIHPNYEDTPC